MYAGQGFPKLVANPIFRPVFDDLVPAEGDELDDSIVTNGPFRITSVDQNGIVLERSPFYWNRDAIKLERGALRSDGKCRKSPGRISRRAIWTLSLMPTLHRSCKNCFRPMTISAGQRTADLTSDDINAAKPPYSDRRVRQALSNAIEREKLTEGEIDWRHEARI